MQSDDMIRATSLAAATLLASVAAAPAQYANEPFFDGTVVQSQAFGLEMAAVRLILAETFQPPFDEELVEQIESAVESDYARFGGTLAQRDPDLAAQLAVALGEVAEAAEEGEATAGPAAAARELLSQAFDVVIDAEHRESPAFKGALALDLLLAEGGVAEGYEEAIENVWEYPSGWAALQRVDLLWEDVAPLATEQRRADAEEMLDQLHALYPDAGPPEPEEVIGWDPEEGEAPAHRLVGILEEVVNADLYPERDMGRLAGHLADLTDQACADYAEGNDAVGAETIYAVFDHYDRHLTDVVALFASDVDERAGDLFGDLISVEEEEDEEEAEAGTEAAADADAEGTDEPADDDADADDEGGEASAEAACRDLAETLAEARSAVGG